MRFNTYLRGLLGLLNAKVEGRAPSEILDAISGNLDCYPFLFAQRREISTFSTAPIGSASEGSVQWNAAVLNPVVPPGEIWLCERYTIWLNVVLPAGEEVTFSPTYLARSQSSGLITIVQVGPSSRALGLPTYMTMTSSEAPFVLLPGDEPAIFVERIVSPLTLALVGSLAFVRCQI